MRDAGVGSLKVEGRMKAPDYVFSVVAAYRDALDALRDGSDDAAARARRDRRLRRAFNRDFTESYLWGGSDNDMMSYERSNNRGELVGRVTGSRALEDAVVRRGGGNGGRERMRRLTRADVEVLLDQPVGAGDLLEIRPPSDPSQFLTAHAEADAAVGETITCRTSRPMEEGSLVRVIRSQAALDEAARVADKDVVRRRPVRVRVTARLGEPFSVELEALDGAAAACAEGFVVEAARTRPVTEGDLVEHVGRMGQSPFAPVEWDVALDAGCGMSFSAVHKVRAEACRLLEEALLAPYADRETKGTGSFVSPYDETNEPVPFVSPAVCVVVTTPACAEARARRRRDAHLRLRRRPRAGLVAGRRDPLARRGLPRGRPRPPGPVGARRRARGGGQRLRARPRRQPRRGPRGPILHPGPQHLRPRGAGRGGAAGVWLSPELTLEEVCALARTSRVPVGLSVLGRERVMTSEHCVLQALGRCRHDCARCPERARSLSLRDIDGNLLPVRTDVNGRSRIWCARSLDATPQVGELVEAGVTRLLVDGQLMTAPEVGEAVTRVVRALEAVRDGRRPAPRMKGATSGHLFSPIG